MRRVIETLDGEYHTLSSTHELEELIGEYMGSETSQYLCDVIEEIEVWHCEQNEEMKEKFEGEIEMLKDKIDKLQEKLDEIWEVLDE